MKAPKRPSYTTKGINGLADAAQHHYTDWPERTTDRPRTTWRRKTRPFYTSVETTHDVDVGHVLTARPDQQLVRFYQRGLVINTHPRQPPGGRSIDATGFAAERSVYALRNVTALQQR
jgi:hypothetical protein